MLTVYLFLQDLNLDTSGKENLFLVVVSRTLSTRLHLFSTLRCLYQ